MGNLDSAHTLTIFLAKQCHGARIDGIGTASVGSDLGRLGQQNPAVHEVLDPVELVASQRPMEGEIESQAIRSHQGPGLPGTLTEDVSQSQMQEMGGSMVALRR